MRRFTRPAVFILRPAAVLLASAAVFTVAGGPVSAEPVVPGTGSQVAMLGDDFEDPDWKFHLNWPKGSDENDGNRRMPEGRAANNRWYEGPKRGEPDYIRRVPTPEGGLPGSTGALLLRTCYSGVPKRPSHKMEQDDFIANFPKGPIPVYRRPSVVVRVFLPPLDEWEQRDGPSFALRCTCWPSNKRFEKDPKKDDTYWPGMMFDYRVARGNEPAQVFLRIRANSSGGDYTIGEIRETGWWTLGMSLSPDGRIHYYARPGIEDLRPEDHLASQYPYGYRAESLQRFFFCVCNKHDGSTWSTPWIVDDPSVYFVPTDVAGGSRNRR